MDTRTRNSTASGLNILAGVWLVIAPFILNYSVQAPRTNDFWVGIGVIVLAVIKAYARERAAWTNWVSGLLGAWLIIAPFVLNYGSNIPAYNDVILGLIVLALAIWDRGASYIRLGRHARA